MNICSYTFEEYVERVRSFHGFVAPGVVIGGFMVDLAYQHLPEDGLFNAISETAKCLPDAIQLLTSCTIGNGWLTVINMGRYAMTLYDKDQGVGIRVFLDQERLEAWSEIKNWFFKMKPKKEQDYSMLMEQIKEAGASICGIKQVKVAPRFLQKRRRGGFAICPLCKEAYPRADGAICLGCQGEAPYLISEIPNICGANHEAKNNSHTGISEEEGDKRI
jgi:formylmethanofuran dehydrogenase subunit E